MKISQEVYDALVEWEDEHETELDVILTKLVGPHEVDFLSTIVDDWWLDSSVSNNESNNRLIAIIRWVNGEDVFEVEKPNKWVVRSKEYDYLGCYLYVKIGSTGRKLKYEILTPRPENATKFDTEEEAESWANAHQEVVEVEG